MGLPNEIDAKPLSGYILIPYEINTISRVERKTVVTQTYFETLV